MLNKIIACAAAAAMGFTFLAAMPLTAEAASSGTCGDSLTWTLDDSGVLTISGTGEMENFSSSSRPWYDSASSITKVVVEEGVTSIGNYAFYDFTSVASIELPESLISIGSDSFSFCYALMDLDLPAGLESIGDWSFVYCTSLTSFTIPENVTSIGAGTFQGCGFTSIEIPSQVTSIGAYAYACCNELTSVTIPATVTELSYGAFSECAGLTSVTIENPECIIGMDSCTISNGTDSSTDTNYFNGTIYGYSGSTAETYAAEFDLNFAVIGSAPAPAPNYTFGDPTGDGAVNLDDAAASISHYAMTAAGLTGGLTAEQLAAANVNGDGAVNLDDAACILAYYAQTAAGLAPTWDDIIGA